MAVFDIFSRRKRDAQGAPPEVYQYEVLPQPFRHQVVHIWRTAIGVRRVEYGGDQDQLWNAIHDTLARELGVPSLSPRGNVFDRCVQFLMTAEVDNCLDLIEISFRGIDRVVRPSWEEFKRAGASQEPDDAIEELNTRFRQHAIGYQYAGGQIVRVDSEFIHAEVVVPALSLIREEGFEGAEEEFRSAHAHYRAGKNEAAIVEALRAFESTMKTICARKGWDHDPERDTASALIHILAVQGLVPAWMESGLTALATLRNRQGGHGQGEAAVDVPPYLAAHALHLAAANIVLLVRAAAS